MCAQAVPRPLARPGREPRTPACPLSLAGAIGAALDTPSSYISTLQWIISPVKYHAPGASITFLPVLPVLAKRNKWARTGGGVWGGGRLDHVLFLMPSPPPLAPIRSARTTIDVLPVITTAQRGYRWARVYLCYISLLRFRVRVKRSHFDSAQSDPPFPHHFHLQPDYTLPFSGSSWYR